MQHYISSWGKCSFMHILRCQLESISFFKVLSNEASWFWVYEFTLILIKKSGINLSVDSHYLPIGLISSSLCIFTNYLYHLLESRDFKLFYQTTSLSLVQAFSIDDDIVRDLLLSFIIVLCPFDINLLQSSRRNIKISFNFFASSKKLRTCIINCSNKS